MRAARIVRAAWGVLALTAAGLTLATPAAADTSASSTGPSGQHLSVSHTEALDPSGVSVTVTGTGYDVAKGIYLAFCVAPESGKPPSPCGGGADTSGSSGSSVWISSDPPSYGKDLAEPYGPGGSFQATLHVQAELDATHDCRNVHCAVVTRADHTRSGDRSQDVVVPVSFTSPGTDGTNYALVLGAPLGGAVVLAAGAWLGLRRRRARPEPADA